MSFEIGFNGGHEVTRSVMDCIATEQAELYFVDGPHFNLGYIDYSKVNDSVWEDATNGVQVASAILGFIARHEVRTSFGYQAVPGYHDKPELPVTRGETKLTVFDFERASLAYEEGVYLRQIAEPARAKKLADNKAEKTPFNKA